MELAGLSCAQAVARVYVCELSPKHVVSHETFSHPCERRVLVCCGPGNQGTYTRLTLLIHMFGVSAQCTLLLESLNMF